MSAGGAADGTGSGRPTSRVYDRLSRWYDGVAGDREWGAVAAGLDLIAVQPGEQVLELGPGPGRALAEMARSAGSGGLVYGLDISPGMCRQARDRLGVAGARGRALALCGDALQLPFARHSVDAVFMSFVLELLPAQAIPAVLAECLRVLRPHGRLAVVALDRRSPASPMQRLYTSLHHHFPRYLDCRPIPVAQLIEAGGFDLQQVRDMSLYGLPVAAALGRPRR